MSALFASWSAEEPYYRRISSRTSFLYALMPTFIAGAEMVRIANMAKDRHARGYLVLEVGYLVLWLAIGLRWAEAHGSLQSQIRQVKL